MSPILLASSLLGACAEVDDDHDGAPASEDCDDGDPWVYPGAPDTPGDGVDSDCLDGDPPYAWLGDWVVGAMTAEYAGLSLFVAGTTGGALAVADDHGATLTLSGTLDPEVIGQEFPVVLTMEGQVSPVAGPDRFVLYAAGDNYDEQMHVDWTCAMQDGGLACEGELKALDISLEATVALSAG